MINVSLVDLTIELKRETTAAEVNALFGEVERDVFQFQGGSFNAREVEDIDDHFEQLAADLGVVGVEDRRKRVVVEVARYQRQGVVAQIGRASCRERV